ncbi:sacsin [Brachionichthys hirsutus]|uniref:sacsin n=1 Tax=Brachionichthys hirsutus TaxID=412623 RepID=UPI003604DFD6
MMSLKTKKKTRTSFGATAPPFIDYLKDILRRYPDGGQILKELIQNADDAEATEVVFIHDERCYGTSSLWTEELGEYQGPALYAYNNAAFTDDDWEGIQKAGRSVKRDDPNKVGRFGIGFNSVYHITDVPCIFSSRHLAFMDPQEKTFGEGEGGFRWYFDDPEHNAALMAMQDQFQPFRELLFLVAKQDWSKVIKEDQHFDGTLFRFPLRNKASDISDNLYDSDRVADLFDSFIADADLSLLFLRHVTSVTLLHISEDGITDTKLKVKSSVYTNPILGTDDAVVQCSTRFKSIILNLEGNKETKWLVTTCTMKEGQVELLDSLAKKLRFVPQVDLAFPCGKTRDCSDSRLSCFLPLPNNESNRTGLPVSVNACFGLTDNRRHIKWQENDQKHDEHAVWNELLIKEVLPRAYLRIIQDAIQLVKDSNLPAGLVYELWPDLSQVEHSNKWHAVALDVLQHLFGQNVAVLSLAKDERVFITPSEAVLPCNGPMNPATVAAIKKTLVSCGENIVTLPASAARALNEANPRVSTLKHATPTFLRGVLCRIDMRILSIEDRLFLLVYVLSDGKYKELKGLQLLPLSDGSFRRFTDREEDTVLIDSNEFPRSLLPCCKHLFIPDYLSPDCKSQLKEMGRKNLFKIINIDANQVAEYTRRYFPQDWKKTGMGPVTWDISNSQHPPLDWLQEFWEFLNKHFKKLSKFSGMPLIPVSTPSSSQSVSLARLQQNTTLIFQKSKQTDLPAQIAQMVNKVGGTVVTGTKWLRHEDLDSYVLFPSPRSVLKVFVNLAFQDLITELDSASHTTRKELKQYLSLLDCLSASERDLLSKLPLFQTMKGSHVAAHSKQAVLLNSGPAIPAKVPIPDSVVLCVTEADRRLFQLLKVKLLSTAEVAVLLVERIERDACRNEDTQNAMAWLLQHGSSFLFQNQTLKQKCKDLNFIEVNGELKKTSCFLNPTIQTFTVIFESDLFPPPLYTQTPQMLQSLTDLGLLSKDVDLSPEHVIRAALQIDQLDFYHKSEALKRARALLKMLDANDLLSKFSHHQLQHLKMLKWVPCATSFLNEQRHHGKKSQNCGLFRPEEIRHSMYEDIVGHVMPLVGNLSDNLANRLALKHSPPPEKVIENLSVLTSEAETMADPDTNVSFKRKLRSIYEHMQNHISEFTRVMSKNTQWLWSHSQFVSPQDLVLDYPRNLDLSSYIRKVPNEFLPYKKLLQEFGLRTSLSDEEVIGLLHCIQQNIEDRQLPFASSAEVKVTIEILNWLWREKKSVKDDIPVPVLIEGEKYALKQLSTAVFCDVSKNGLKELEYSQEEIHVVHDGIPKATAEWLNIRLLSTHILDPELVGIEQCGQSEPITTRIKNILKEYDEDNDIFKELIQNAEDAGAGVCRFMVDFRVHRDAADSLIDPDMTLCQGPCLWAYNNERFTPEDWTNIIRVGAASKEDKVEKIGKFGLGFNTVYHVTDVPSILSGNHLLILDPNVTHLKKHIKHKTNPGIKLNLSQQRLFHCFPGQFGPYEGIFDCDFKKQIPPEPYHGTLIKLPFRTEEEACKSEISTKVYNKHDINSLLKHLTEKSESHLLFLKNINTLSLHGISKDASTPPRDDNLETIFSISKATTEIGIPDKTCHMSKQHQAEQSLMKLDRKCREVIDNSAFKIVQITSERCGVAEVQSWLLYNCFGTNRSLKMALQENEKAKFSLPIGGIAVPLQFDPQSGEIDMVESDNVGHAFCFLPLSIQTGLPVNLNGTFAVTSNRKGLWETGVKQDWNKALLQDPVVTAYVTLLLLLKTMSESKQLKSYMYYKFWPNRENVSQPFKPLVDAFYSIIAQNSSSPKLFSDGKHWCSLGRAVFLHESIEEDQTISAFVAHVCKEHVKAPNHFVPLPLWLRNSFKQAGLKKVLEDRVWNWEKCYQEVVFNNLDAMDPKIRDALILHAIDLNIQEIDHLLVQHPCIPTKGGQLQYIRKLVNPSGKVACLFESDPNRLLCGTIKDFCSTKRIQRLFELGMANDHLPLKDIAEKASTIAETWSTDSRKAYEHLKCLLELMKNHKYDNSSPHWKTLRTIDFLPAFSPGDIKMERNVTLKSPTGIFSDKCSLLVNMTQPVLDHINLKIHNTDPVLEMLGVHDSPQPETVIKQLQKACKHSQSTDRAVLHKIAYECYKFLDQWLVDSTHSSLISQGAKTFPFILIGSTFVNVSRVAENEQFEAKPYLFVLPPAFTFFKRLWECVGVEKHFTTHQFQAVLKDLHTKHGNKPLPKSDLALCLTILNTGIYEAKETTTDDFFIPNEKGVLQPASKMFYNDSPWMTVTSAVTLCHENISRVVACYLGIRTTRHDTLQNHEIKNISPFSFQFEQQEQLTVRIKNIISAYPSKKDIIKELIQNADDAESTEIHFIWDKRQHGKTKTFGKKWNNLQGPALCVFNNKVFSDADLTGIQQLGEGGKRHCPGKTGKYGVGFNSVYHLTDCPSILTGDKLLCISDPNQKYIESHADQAPAGIGYKLADDFKNMYMDVYKTFLPDAFPLKEGTMFRLPLRMGTMAESSNISKQGVTEDDMKELCSTLVEDPEGLILFLKNICKIQVHEINSTEELKTIFMVEKTLPKKSRKVKKSFRELHHEALQSDKAIKQEKAIYETIISTSDERQSRWMIAEQFDTSENSGGREITVSDQLPRAAVAARMSSKSLYPETSSRKNAIGEAFCSLPLPGKTGLPVHINANFEVDSSRRGLWKEDGQSLKSNWNESLKQNVIAPLYADLLYCICHNIPHQRIRLPEVESYFSRSYLCFWPTVSKDVGQDWHEMILEVYRSITKRGLKVIPVVRSSVRMISNIKITEYSFDWCKVTEAEKIKAPHLTNSNYVMNPILENLGMTLVPFSMEMEKVWKCFRSAGVEVKNVNPSNVRAFLMEKSLNDPTQTDKDLPLPVAATLIRNEKRCSRLLSYCLSDFEGDLKKVTKDDLNLLNGLPLLLTSNKMLRVFNSKSPSLISEYDCLFIFNYKNQFADYQTNKQHIQVLKHFKLVEGLTVGVAAQYLKPAIQQHLQDCPVDPHNGLHVPNETMLKWLKLLWKFLTSQMKAEASCDDEQSLTISDVRKLFSQCFILPVVCPRLNNKHFLQTMKDMPNVIHFHTESDISGILFKLAFLKLDITFFHEINAIKPDVHSLLRPELMDVNDKSSVLDRLYNINSSEFSQLSTDELTELQCFLQNGVSKSEDKREYQRKLKSLPLFETIHGSRVRIDELEKVFVLDSQHSMGFPELCNLADRSNIFLKNNPENSSLAKILDIQTLNDSEYFMKFILPSVHSLTETQLLECLKLFLSLYHYSSFGQNKVAIISALKSVQLIRSSQGRLECASYYFDETVALYQKMVPKESFIPQRFWTVMCGEELPGEIQTRELLRELGMKHVVSENDIITFAHQLESEAKGNGPFPELKRKSSLILGEAMTILKINKYKDTFLETIADIKFIFPKRIRDELCNYHQPFAPERTTVKIRGSLINDDLEFQHLIWSSMPIIHFPISISEELEKPFNSLGAHKQPPLHCITKNLSNICQSPCNSDGLIKTRAKVFRTSYAFLQAHEFDSQPLAGLPVVLVESDTELVKTDDVSLSLSDALEFRPYLYNISKDIKFEDFFKKIGVSEKPTALQYCNVLAAVYADSFDKAQLNPNQQKTVKRAVQHFFQLFQTEGSQPCVEDASTLYLPAVDGKLHPTSTLYYNDTVFEIKRIEEALNDMLLLERLSLCHLGNDIYMHHQLIQLLPQKFQPKMLSQITEEQVVEKSMQLCELESDCEFRGWFEKHLSSVAFRYGLICLIRGQSQGQINQEDAMDMCNKTFGSIQIVCCKSLETTLWLEKRPLNKTETETDVFVKRGEQGCTFYLKHNNDMVAKVINDINMTLTKEINALLGNKIESIHLPVLGQLLMCDDLKDVRKALSKSGIRDSAENEGFLLNPPAPGTDIPEEWHDALDMSFLNIFEEGEYVGYWTNSKYIYAVIVEELPEHSGLYSRRYKIDIGEEGPIEVSCLDLYQFKRQKGDSGGRRSTSTGASCMELEPHRGAEPHGSQSSSTSSSPLPASIEEAKREIDECLAEIWTLPEEERLKAIKRLYLRWHPDKNLDCQYLATEAFKYLQNRITELEKGKGSASTSNSFRPERSWNFNFRNFYSQWDQEARHHRRGRERFFRGYQSYSFWTHNDNIPRPNKEEAQRWFRQARCDLNAAYKDVGGGNTEWCLFKVHQAVEKSLIAAVYRRNGQHPINSCISAMAADVSSYSIKLRRLPQIVETLKTMGVDAKKTQYPNCHRSPHIPHGQFRSENEERALSEAVVLLSIVEEYVN